MPGSERANLESQIQLLKSQIKAYEFYAGLIDRAVVGGASSHMPRWDDQRALEYTQLSGDLRTRLAELEEQLAELPAAPAAPTQASTPPEAGDAKRSDSVATATAKLPS